MRRFVQIICAVVMAVAMPGAVSAQEWVPWSPPADPDFVGVQFVYDDGGALIVLCHQSQHFLSYILREPRANWLGGSIIEVKTRADDGSEAGPSPGQVLKADTLTVLEEAKWDIYTMGQGKVFFSMRAGGFARRLPMQNFKTLMEPVLQACDDHW
jgi:hypothetical protein